MFSKIKFERALTFESQGRAAEAERLYRELLVDDPKMPQPADRLGALALGRADAAAALTWFERALTIDPGFTPARVNLGLALQQLKRRPEARAAFEAAALRAPRYAPAHQMLGLFLWDGGDFAAAAQSLGRAMALDPAFSSAFQNDQIGRLSNCDWRGYDEAAALATRLVRGAVANIDPIAFMYASNLAADHCASGRLAGRRYPAMPPLEKRRTRRPGKIRLGYLASDFYDHAVAHAIIGVLEHHDRDQFELTAFSYCPAYPSPIRDRVVAAFDTFLNIKDFDDASIARLIHEREIDVLVNLSGYAYRARPQILSWRPAPVQVSYLGFPGSMGAPFVDYLIADRIVIPPPETRLYSEKIAWMPHCYHPTDDTTFRGPPVSTRQAEGLPDEAIVLMAYNQPGKIAPQMFAAWMNVLRRVPKAVLWLADGGEAACGNLGREAVAAGIDPTRLVFAPRLSSREAHLARHHLADLFIDTLPYNAHTTASDALWFGLPVVTCRGGAFPGRVCASLLTAAGFPELVCENLEDYEALIVDLAEDPARLATLRARVSEAAPKSPLFDTTQYTRDLEAAYRAMHARSQSASAPKGFDVAALDR